MDGKRLLPESAFVEAHRSQAVQDESFGPFRRTGYGLGWNLGTYDKDAFLHHFGGYSGFHSHVGFTPEKRVGVAIVVNESGSGAFLAQLVSEYAYALLGGETGIDERGQTLLAEYRKRAGEVRGRIAADRARRAARPQELPHPPEGYTGVFENPLLGRVSWKLVNGKLEVTMGRLWSSVEVYDGARNALRVELAGGGQVVFFNFADGAQQAQSFTYNDLVFERIKE